MDEYENQEHTIKSEDEKNIKILNYKMLSGLLNKIEIFRTVEFPI